MKTSPRTSAASAAAQDMIEMGIDRREIGFKKLLLALGWTAINGASTEPEIRILLGRAGMAKRYANQGYLIQNDLPPGLKSAPHFPHQHYYHLTEKGMLMLTKHVQHLAGYGNLELRQRLYLHDFICRIEAAWRTRLCLVEGYLPEVRLPELSSPNHKQHDGHLLLHGGGRIGLEVEAADWKSGDKLARFAAQCLNSITNNRVQRVLVLVQTEAAVRHYSKPFQTGQAYCPEWMMKSGKWSKNESSRTTITPDLAAKVSVKLITTEEEIAQLLMSEPTEFLPSALRQIEEEAQRREQGVLD